VNVVAAIDPCAYYKISHSSIHSPAAITNGGCSIYATCSSANPDNPCTCNKGYSGDGYTCNGENY